MLPTGYTSGLIRAKHTAWRDEHRWKKNFVSPPGASNHHGSSQGFLAL